MTNCDRWCEYRISLQWQIHYMWQLLWACFLVQWLYIKWSLQLLNQQWKKFRAAYNRVKIYHLNCEKIVERHDGGRHWFHFLMDDACPVCLFFVYQDFYDSWLSQKNEDKFILARPWLPWPVQFKAVLVRMSLSMRIRGKVQNKSETPFPAGCGPAPVLWWAWKSVGFLLSVITTITPAPLTRQPGETFPAMCDEEVDRLRVCIRDNLVSEAVDS